MSARRTRKVAADSVADAASVRRRHKVAACDDTVDAWHEPDLDEAVDLVMQLMAIPGGSGREGAVAEFVIAKLQKAGLKPAAIRHDTAHKRSILGGELGNLIVRLPGTMRRPRRLLMAHLDTVPICLNARPVLRGDFIHAADAHTGLGADNRAGVAAVLLAGLEILRHKLSHPPLTLFFPVQEEVGLQGVRNASFGLLGKPKIAVNFDGGSPFKATIGATGGYRLTIEIAGRASHAGNNPELGVSAVAIAAVAIADLQRGGWHGLIEKGRRRGTSNFGVIEGGQATNVVTDRVLIRAEARSHDPQFRQRIVQEIEQAFEAAVDEVVAADGRHGSVHFEGRLDYESFRLADDDKSLREAEGAILSVGGQPVRTVTNGGLDANWMTARGIPTVTLGCGQLNQHTVDEQLSVPDYYQACRIALRLATG